jgi:hypothetical protein
VTDAADLDDFLQKWRAAWPEWPIARGFVAPADRDRAEAWLALWQEWTDAAWAGDDPTPGFAKLGWWQEELLGWDKGARRHPLGRVLQKTGTRWSPLAGALGALREVRTALRDGAAPASLHAPLAPLAEALHGCERTLFAQAPGAPRDATAANAIRGAQTLIAQHALWHGAALAAGEGEGADAAQHLARAAALARSAAAAWPAGAAPRPRRVYEALLRARLADMARGRGLRPVAPLRTLWLGWRAARG